MDLLSLLKHTPYARLLAAMSISLLGNRFSTLAVPWLVYEVSGHNPIYLGISEFCAIFPQVILSPISGVLVDRWNIKRILYRVDFLLCGFTACIPLIVHYGAGSDFNTAFALVCSVQTIIAVLYSLYDPAIAAVLPETVPAAQLKDAYALSRTVNSIISMIGWVLAGLLIAWFGAQTLIVLDAASFMFSGIIITTVAFPQKRPMSTPVSFSYFKDQLSELFSFMKRDVQLLPILTLSSLAALFFGAMVPLLMILTRSMTIPSSLSSSQTLGIILSVMSAGSVCGAQVVRKLIGRYSFELVFYGGALTASLSMLSFGLQASSWHLSAAFVFLYSFANGGSAVASSVYLANAMPFEKRGRLFSILLALNLFFMSISSILFPSLSARFDPATIIVSMSLMCALCVVVVYTTMVRGRACAKDKLCATR